VHSGLNSPRYDEQTSVYGGGPAAAVNRTPGVKRVVHTSSVAAMYGPGDETGPGKVLTEEDWNVSSTETFHPYAYSKTVAERRAWELAGQQDRCGGRSVLGWATHATKGLSVQTGSPAHPLKR
jgi:nucleoside-diphosphate-sugar epimerase